MTIMTFRDRLPSIFVDTFKFSCDGDLFIDENWKLEGVTSQFVEDADTYHDRYFDRLDFLNLTDRCFTLAGIDYAKKLTVLDIGSGGGSSVFSTAKLLVNAEVVASDISLPLLKKVTEFVAKKDVLRARIAAVAFDLHRQVFKDSQFDMIVGMAILHHLVNPLDALKNVVTSLKVGGQIILVEPLEGGHLALLTLYDQILLVLQNLHLEEDRLAKLISALRFDYQARMGVPIIQEWTPHLDDKWIFGEAYLERLRRDLGLASIKIYPAQSQMRYLFETTFRSLLSDSGNSNLDIPPDVVRVIKDFDLGISNELKKRLCPTGIIVMTK